MCCKSGHLEIDWAWNKFRIMHRHFPTIAHQIQQTTSVSNSVQRTRKASLIPRLGSQGQFLSKNVKCKRFGWTVPCQITQRILQQGLYYPIKLKMSSIHLFFCLFCCFFLLIFNERIYFFVILILMINFIMNYVYH